MSRLLYTILPCKTTLGRQLPGFAAFKMRLMFETPLTITPQPDKAAEPTIKHPSLCQVITFCDGTDSQSIKPGISAGVPLSPAPTPLHLFSPSGCRLLRETLPQYYGPRRR